MNALKSNKRLFAFLIIVMLAALVLAACQPAASSESEKVPKPSNAGGPGPALQLTGDAAAGATVFSANCVACHGDQGKTGVANAGSTDGTVPSLNPVDEALKDPDKKVFAQNLDLFIEHGSTPEGTSPALSMLPFGDNKTLTPQQIADVIAYVISLNP
jgi:mono/diheme cytochrome c family protein